MEQWSSSSSSSSSSAGGAAPVAGAAAVEGWAAVMRGRMLGVWSRYAIRRRRRPGTPLQGRRT